MLTKISKKYMKTNDIKVSIIMPVYNSGKYLKTVLESILNQSLKEFELILVDDGSTDGSSERCDKYAERDVRVVVIHQKNGGICNARNAALQIAKGKYIGFSDHDDEYSPKQLEDNYNRIEASGVDIIKYGSRAIQSYKGRIFRNDIRSFDDEELTNEQMKNNFWQLWRNYAFESVWDSLFRKSFLDVHGIKFNPFFKTGSEDYDFLWHCLGKGASFEFNSNIYYNHYIRQGFSTSTKFHEYAVRTVLERPQVLFAYLQDWMPILKENKLEYSYFWLQMVLGSLCHTLAHPACKMSIAEKVKIVSGLKEAPHFHDWILDTDLFDLVKIASLRYGLLLWLYKHCFYSLCVILYEMQYRERMNIFWLHALTPKN